MRVTVTQRRAYKASVTKDAIRERAMEVGLRIPDFPGRTLNSDKRWVHARLLEDDQLAETQVTWVITDDHGKEMATSPRPLETVQEAVLQVGLVTGKLVLGSHSGKPSLIDPETFNEIEVKVFLEGPEQVAALSTPGT